MRLLRPLAAAIAVGLIAFATSPAEAKLLIEIDKSAQRMVVSENGAQLYVWPVSTGISRYDTPAGEFAPNRMERDHFSREWDDAPMPNSIFFTNQGHAIHGTYHRSLGQPASHGCVRLSVQNSRVLFDLVKREGMANTRVVLFGSIPGGGGEMARRGSGQWQEYGAPRYDQRYDDDDIVTGSAPRRGMLPTSREPIYRERYPDRVPVYGDRGFYRAPPPPQPYYLPGRRSYWD